MRAIVDQPEGSSPERTKRSRSIRAIIRDGIALAYEETGAGTPPVLLVHGWGCDHSFLAPQAEHFSRNHRVVSVDLRGHGASDAPRQEYTVARFADDLGFLCDRLDLHEAVVVGHSMGGNIALELAARRPDLTAAVAIIDSVAFPQPALLEALRPLADALRGPGYVEALHAAVSPLFLPVDDPGRKARILTAMARTPQHVLASAFVGHVTAYDARAAATACRVPVAYIGAAVPLADLSEFRTVCPHLLTGQTLGSGHFSPLEVPDQVNAKVARFIAILSYPWPGAPRSSKSLAK